MIRLVERDDIADCVAVIRDSFATVADEFGFTPDNAPRFTAFATTEERLSWQLKKEKRPMYAFCADGRIVGYYSLALQEGQMCELNNLCVLPEFRHRGIGEALLRHAFETAQALGCTKMHIGIVEENQCLKTWYASFGFAHTGTQKYDFFPFICFTVVFATGVVISTSSSGRSLQAS